VAALDILIALMLVLMSTGGDALDLWQIAFLLLVAEAFLTSSWAFWPRLLLVLAVTDVTLVRAGATTTPDLAKPLVLATIAALVFVMHASRDRARADLHVQASRDPLTGLLNRRALQTHLDAAVGRMHYEQTSFAVIYIDLDGFKVVNDTYGHDVGDLLLSEAARRVEQLAGNGDRVGRIGGDEFAVLLSSVTSAVEAGDAARCLIRLLKMPFLINGRSVHISASMGIAMASPASRQSPRELLGDADRAMHAVKKTQKGDYAFAW
jgi:diguanylate cyclase (GGDEF)-like protein